MEISQIFNENRIVLSNFVWRENIQKILDSPDTLRYFHNWKFSHKMSLCIHTKILPKTNLDKFWTTCELSNLHFYEGFPLNIRFSGEYSQRDSPKIFWRVQWSGFIGQEKGVSRKKEKRLDCDPFKGLFSVFWFRIE